jgi:peptide/nickel transport system permease protein
MGRPASVVRRSSFAAQLRSSGRFVGGAVVRFALALWALGSAVFLMLRVLPGDTTTLVLGDQASSAERQALRRMLHLEENVFVQYARFLQRFVTFSFGPSLRRPDVLAETRILHAFVPTASLAIAGVGVGALLGTACALLIVHSGQPRLARALRMLVDSVAAMPLLVLAPVATYALAVRTNVVPLPGDPDAGLRGLLFGASLLALPLGAQVARFGIAALEAQARAQYLTVAVAKGASRLRVAVVHALRASASIFAQISAAQLGALLGGAVVLERLFEREGLGALMLEAYAARDLPVLEGAVLTGGVLFVSVQTAATLLQYALDPRVRPA